MIARVLRDFDTHGARVVVSTPPTRRGNGKVRVAAKRSARGWVLTAIATNADPIDGVRVEVRQEGYPTKADALGASCFLRSIAAAELARGRSA